MHVHHILRTGFQNELPDRFKKWETLNVSGRAADLGDHYVIFARIGEFANTVLDYVGDMRDHLHSFPQIIAAPLLQDDRFVNLAACQVIVPGKNTVREPLIMTKIKVGFRAIVQHINFAMLEWIHRPRVNVEIRIEFLENNAQTTQLKQRAERSRSQPFAQRAHDATCNENVLHETTLRFARLSVCSSACASRGVSTPGDPLAVTST